MKEYSVNNLCSLTNIYIKFAIGLVLLSLSYFLLKNIELTLQFDYLPFDFTI